MTRSTDGRVSIDGLDKAAVLAALYNAAETGGMGLLAYKPEPMSAEAAQELLDTEQTYFDYLHGRVMKVDLSGDDGFSPFLYDRDNGEGAAALIVATLRATGNVNAPAMQELHQKNTARCLAETREQIETPTTIDDSGGMTVVSMGLADVAEHLKPAIARASEHIQEAPAEPGDEVDPAVLTDGTEE